MLSLITRPRQTARSVSHTGTPPGTRRVLRLPCASIPRPGAVRAAGDSPGEDLMSTAASPKVTPPAQGAKIAISNGKLVVPQNPIVPFIEGDGTGPDIWRASVRVMDAAVAKAYGGQRRIHWMEVYAGEKSNKLFNTWLRDDQLAVADRDLRPLGRRRDLGACGRG